MKKKIITLAIATLALAVAPLVSADSRTYTERECSTDSYGNTTCRDKTVNVETGVITYSNQQVVGRVDSSVIGTGGSITYGNMGGLTILNTGFPDVPSVAAGATVALGGVSYLIKRLRARKQ